MLFRSQTLGGAYPCEVYGSWHRFELAACSQALPRDVDGEELKDDVDEEGYIDESVDPCTGQDTARQPIVKGGGGWLGAGI